MSLKRKLNIVELIIEMIFIVSSVIFETISFSAGFDSVNSYGWDVHTDATVSVSLIAYAFLLGIVFGIVLIGIMLSNAIACLTSVFGNSNDKDGKLHIVLPILQLIIVAPFLNLFGAPGDFNNIVRNSVFVTFAFICMFAILVLAIIKRTEKVAPSKEKTVVNQISSADELNKLKDLLDSGVITQEEFDQKKKQLLGL